MPKSEQKGLEPRAKVHLIKRLHKSGEKKWLERWREHIAIPRGIDPESTDEQERERVLRYALLRAVINQQAVAEKARELSRSLYEVFRDDLLLEPQRVVARFAEAADVFREVGGPKGDELYHVAILGGIKPISLFLYRLAAFAIFIPSLRESIYKTAHQMLQQEDGVRLLIEWLRDHPVLQAGWVGNDPKACRMAVDWFVFLFCEVWKEPAKVSLKDTVMIVDGHVGKVFARTGLLDTVVHVKKDNAKIYAMHMREEIESLVAGVADVIPFHVDNGAFYLYEDGFDKDIAPQCEKCPIESTCLKHTHWTAYANSPMPPYVKAKPSKRRSRILREAPSLFDALEGEG